MVAAREDVEFESNGAALRGWLYRADGASPAPGVVMAHGMSAVKEMFLDDYAAAFASAGITTLVYDHFGFGTSGGEPRQAPSPEIQLLGYRDAITWLGRQEGVDVGRIGIWGSSFSGGHVIRLAAEDLPIACAVAQVPHLAEGDPLPPAGFVAELTAAIEAGRLDAVVPAVTADPQGTGLMYEDAAFEWFTRVAAERAPTWRDEVQVGALAAGADHRPIEHLPNARVPLLLVVAPADRLTPPGPATPIAEKTDNVTIVEIPGDHFDAYEAGFDASSSPAVEWFRKYLGA